MFWTIFIVTIICGILSAVGTHAIHKKAEALTKATIESLPNFTPTRYKTGCDSKSGIAFDQSTSCLCLLKHSAKSVQHRVITHKQIISVELFQDGDSITKTSRSSQLGGAVIGGLALGGVGAIIGGLSGKTRTSTRVKHIELRLIVDNTTDPLHDVVLMNTECSKEGPLYKDVMNQAREWVGIIDILIKRAELDAKTPSVIQLQPEPTRSVADEVRKLADLVKDGALTMDEFKAEKARLIGSPAQLSSKETPTVRVA